MKRPGVSVVELLAALTLGGIVVAIVGGALLAQLRLARFAAERALAGDALRTATAVLHGELARATGADVRAVAADSVALRSFRGLARICAVDYDRVHVHYRGDRLPDSRKDSLLVIDGTGAEFAFAVRDVRYQDVTCDTPAPGEAGLVIRLSAPAAPRGAALVFESGSYYLSTRALRYRLGAEGRQPLTAEAFTSAGNGFTRVPHGVSYRFRTVRGDAVTGTAALGQSLP